MPPGVRKRASPQEANGATQTSNKRSTRSSTKRAITPPENEVVFDGAAGETRSSSGRVKKVMDKKTKHSAKQTLKAKKMAAHREKKTVKGPSEAQELDNVDEDEHSDKPNPRYEEELADDEPPQKRRSYAPVTISDNEAPESDKGDDDDQSEDMENGTSSNPSQKRKRPIHPNTDTESAVEVEYTVVDEVVPQTQNETNQLDGWPMPPMRSDPPTTSPHHPPLSSHAIHQDNTEDKTHKVGKPKSKLMVRALQNARAEVPKFINSDSDDEAPAGKRHRVVVGDGKKPAVTKEDPVFDAVYKSAASELKRQICFVNAFPDSIISDNLPRAVYNYGVHFMNESGLYGDDELRKLSKGFDGQWFSCLNHQISSFRAKLKKATLKKVHDHFGSMDYEKRNSLLATNEYWYEISVTGEANLDRPFLNKAIVDILKEEYFDGRKSLYKLYPQEFKQSLATKDGGKGLEIPPKLVALVATFVYYTLSSGDKSAQSWKYETFSQIYNGHLAELKKIARDSPQCYHLILNLLFIKCIGDNGPKFTQPAIVSRNDYRSLNPANFLM